MSICKWKQYNKEEILNFLLSSYNKSNFLLKMGYERINSNAYAAIKKEYSDFPWEQIENCNKPEDLTGLRSGKLTVLYLDQNSKRPHWICKCDCGQITKPIAAYSLKHQITKSCGCLQKEIVSEKSRNNLIGKRFGKLTVKELAQISPLQWKCTCDCGKEKIVKSAYLLSGRTKSCGCLISQGELKIMKILDSLNLSYKTQFSFSDLRGKEFPLRFDFAIFNNDTIIALLEYQGEQHYKPTSIYSIHFESGQENDQKKRDYCKKHDLKLIEIPYWDYNKISKDYILNQLESK